MLIGSVRSFWSSQSNALVSALVLLAAAAVVRGRMVAGRILAGRAGACESLAAGRRRIVYRAMAEAVGGEIGSGHFRAGIGPLFDALPAAVAAQFSDWYRCLAERQTHGSRTAAIATLGRSGSRFTRPSIAVSICCCKPAAGLAVLGWCLWQRRRGLPTVQLVMYTISAWSVWQLFCGPGTERLTYNLIAPSIAWGLLTSFHERRGRTLIALSAVATYLFSFGATERLLSEWWPAARALEPIGVLLFAGWLVWHAAWAKPWDSAAAEAEEQSAFAPPGRARKSPRGGLSCPQSMACVGSFPPVTLSIVRRIWPLVGLFDSVSDRASPCDSGF